MGRYSLERKAVSWSRLGARYCVRLEMRYLIFVQRIVNKNNLSLLRRIWSQCKYSDHCHLSLVTPSHKSSSSPWCLNPWVHWGQSSLFAQKIECYLIVLKVFCIIVKPGHDTGLGRIHELGTGDTRTGLNWADFIANLDLSRADSIQFLDLKANMF